MLSAVVGSCSEDPGTAPDLEMPPQTVVLFATPKIISDFSSPAADVARFLDHYLPLTSRAAETIVIFAVGNSEHILEYRGRDFWDDEVEWARHTGFRIPVSDGPSTTTRSREFYTPSGAMRLLKR